MSTLSRYTANDLDFLMDAIEKTSIGLGPTLKRLDVTNGTNRSYPPYNIIKNSEDNWEIEMALAGWDSNDIEVSTEQTVLTIASKKQLTGKEEVEPRKHLHRGLASREFKQTFNLADDVEIGEVQYKNGLLSIDLKKIVPEHQKKKVFDIS